MNTYTRILLMLSLGLICCNSYAAQRFVVKYLPDVTQTYCFVNNADYDCKKCRAKMMEKLSDVQLEKLTKAANAAISDINSSSEIPLASKIQVKYFKPVSTGSHVIILSKELDEKQVSLFISIVKEDKTIDYIEEDALVFPAY